MVAGTWDVIDTTGNKLIKRATRIFLIKIVLTLYYFSGGQML